MNKEEICFMSACDMADSIKRQELTSQEITEAIIERIEKINPIINAYCTPTFDLARDMAKEADKRVKNGEKLGLLNGIPTSIKDLAETKGIRTTYGSLMYEHNVPEYDQVFVERLKNAGCVIMGKTNTPEFGHVTITDNFVFGLSKNPWNIERTTGGSSGGAAAAATAGISPLAQGSDGGGSIRVPSALNGVFGIMPTYGRVPKYPREKIYHFYNATYGSIARYVKDAALMLDVMKGAHPGDRMSLPADISYFENIDKRPNKLKIGYDFSLGIAKAVETEVEEAVLKAVQKFEQLDYSIEKVRLRMKKAETVFYMLSTTTIAHDLKSALDEWEDKLSPGVVRQVKMGLEQSSLSVTSTIEGQNQTYEIMHRFFKEYDILITPTTCVPAFEHGIVGPEKIKGKVVSHSGWYAFTFPFNVTGLPAASIPCGFTQDGLPIGMQIVGRRLDDLTVLQVAKAFEEIAPWQDKKPKFN
jgi:aspartyl-tRNA(Asn)/glutamyl-tRNA(Gln) amidotransferase subunit A